MNSSKYLMLKSVKKTLYIEFFFQLKTKKN